MKWESRLIVTNDDILTQFIQDYSNHNWELSPDVHEHMMHHNVIIIHVNNQKDSPFQCTASTYVPFIYMARPVMIAPRWYKLHSN